MRCLRCDGLMVRDRFIDMLGAILHIDAWRCIACGNVVDEVILRNRRAGAGRHVAR